MVKKRHTAEQIIAKLREAEVLLAKGGSMGQVCRKLKHRENRAGRADKRLGCEVGSCKSR